jgi:hypothetical protein
MIPASSARVVGSSLRAIKPFPAIIARDSIPVNLGLIYMTTKEYVLRFRFYNERQI